MNSAGCSRLTLSGENGTWYRAVNLKFWNAKDPLSTKHTKPVKTRFSPGEQLPLADQFEILYLGEDHQVALFEVQALLGTPTTALPSPTASFATIAVSVCLQSVADICKVSEQKKLKTNAQELTGDWNGYANRSSTTSVKEPTGVAPTQSLGFALAKAPTIEAFRAVSAKIPESKTLVIFPSKLKTGSWLRYFDPKTSKTFQVDGTI